MRGNILEIINKRIDIYNEFGNKDMYPNIEDIIGNDNKEDSLKWHIKHLDDEEDRVRYPVKYWEYYFRNIFPISLAMFRAVIGYQVSNKYAGLLPTIPDIINQPKFDILISLVGYSPEPILHTICALKPKQEIHLICSKETENLHEGMKFIDFVSEFVTNNRLKLCEAEDSKELKNIDYKDEKLKISLRTIKSMLPGETAERIKEIIDANNDKEIALDITGGKKTMISSAYTIASILSIPAFYVDFQEYDMKSGRPSCCTEYLNLLENPLRDYKLIIESGLGKLKNYLLKGNYISPANYSEACKKIGLPNGKKVAPSDGLSFTRSYK